MGVPWGPLIGGAISLIGGSKQASAARRSAEAQNEAAERQFEYNKEAYEMRKDRLDRDRAHAVEEIGIRAANEAKVAAFKDASAMDQYNYQLQIRNKQQDTNEKMFKKSEDIYQNQMSINSMAEQRGVDDENRKLEEIYAEAAFDKEAAYLDSMEAEGKMRARGVVGRSADKLAQATAFQTGKKLTMLNLSLDNAEAASNSVLQGIKIDKNIADLNAFAAKMLDPGVLPMPVQPLKTPMATYIYPPALQEFDYGPEPVMGATVDAGAASSGIWGSAIAGIAGQVGNYFMNQNNQYK
tara:strand:+ start:651 stop:1538 length:888 start_codon:yes stop_codon:yes gene_type:complete